MTTKTITSEELWEEVDANQEWLDTLPEQGAEELRAEAELAAADEEWVETKRQVLILEVAADSADRLLLEMGVFADRAWDALLILQEMADDDTRAAQSVEPLAKMRTLVREIAPEFAAERGMFRVGVDRSLLSALRNREHALRQKIARLEARIEAEVEPSFFRRLWRSVLRFLDA